MKRLLFILTLASLLVLSGCGFSVGNSANPPTDLQVAAGDSSVTATWTMAPNVEYWLLYAPATSISTANWTTLPGAKSIIKAVSPQLVPALVNGQVYSFVMDARINGGPAGTSTASVSTTPRNAGSTWKSGSSLGAMTLRGAAFNQLAAAATISAVAVGANGAIFSSIDGLSWTAQTNPVPTANLSAIVYSGNYLAVGASGMVLLSADAITWTQQTAGTSADLNALATNGAGLFVIAGANGTLLINGGGSTWSAVASGTTNNLTGVTYGNGRFVAVGANGTLLTSVDGVTWAASSSNTVANLNGVAYGSWLVTATGAVITTFVAVGDNGTMVTSPDGLTWTALTPVTTSSLSAVDFGRQFVAVGSKGAVVTSLDGVTWLAQTSGTSNDLKAVSHNPYGYIALGTLGTNLSSW